MMAATQAEAVGSRTLDVLEVVVVMVQAGKVQEGAAVLMQVLQAAASRVEEERWEVAGEEDQDLMEAVAVVMPKMDVIVTGQRV